MLTKFLENIILPLGDFFNKSSFVKQLKYWRKVDSLSEKELENLQKQNLKKLLLHTVKNVPSYENIVLKGNNPEKWLKSFPILTKSDIRIKSDSLIAKKSKKTKLIKYSSSGSSGLQSSVFMTKKEQSNIRAILIHWWEWTGYKMGNHIVQTGITPQRGLVKTIKDLLFNTYYISAFSISKLELDTLLKKINNSKKYYLAGYPSSINIIAEYAIEKKSTINLKSVITLGDKLFSNYKKNIEKAFQTKVYDTYGCNEGFLIASEKDIEYKYIMSPHVYLEILDNNNKPVVDGEMGNVVVTRLDGFSMPLIRYKIGDLAIKLPKEKYPKKRDFNYPLLQQIVGRETDVVLLPNEEKLVVHSFTGIFEYVPEIKQFKVIQENINGMLIEYIKDENFTDKVLVEVTTELQKYIKNKNFKIIYKEVDFISPTKSGKPQIIESKLKI